MDEKKENRLYEDEEIIAYVPSKPLLKGHIIVESKKEEPSVQEMEEKDFQHLVYGASFAATALFENLAAQGTNIIINTGGKLKKRKEGMKAHVLARMIDDGAKLMWTPKEIPEPEMKQIQEKIKDKCGMLGIKKKEKEVINLDKKKIEKVETEIKRDEKKKKEETNKEPAISEQKAEKRTEKEKKSEIKETKKEENKNEEKEESYLIKQLRRLP